MKMLSSVTEISDISDVTPASDDVQSKNAHIFQYNLNTGRTKKHLYEGAMRGHFEREDKKVCINLSFSDGAFSEAVLKAVSELRTGPTCFNVWKE